MVGAAAQECRRHRSAGGSGVPAAQECRSEPPRHKLESRMGRHQPGRFAKRPYKIPKNGHQQDLIGNMSLRCIMIVKDNPYERNRSGF